ncbi:MAG: class I SAM-dependent methyltransferase [Lentisphaerae bacterium]|nr:class I SAM-dependent methyltransferase [Lentisphaerota bacterium]
MSKEDTSRSFHQQRLRLYHDLADWYPLLTPVDDYIEEAAFYRRLFETHCQGPPRTLLDLGSGGGHNAAHLKSTFACTLVDIAPAMLTLSRRLNPNCEHMAYLLRGEDGEVEVVHERHPMGLFPRAVWLELIAAAGFEPLVVPFEHSSYSGTAAEVFLGLRTGAKGAT